VPAEKTIVIHNPVDVARVRRLSAQPITPDRDGAWWDHDGFIRLVAMGRLEYQKGFDLLIHAVALCNNPRLRLRILGEGPLRSELEALARERGVASQVHLEGFQVNPYPILQRAHAFVLSSRFEGLPNVILEALACGTPVIATPAPGGVRETLLGRPGCVIADEISARGLAKAVGGFPFDQVRDDDQPQLNEYSAESIGLQYQALFSSPFASTA
jgi:glycosyltransferase involved in cell wall biosynthesis